MLTPAIISLVSECNGKYKTVLGHGVHQPHHIGHTFVSPTNTLLIAVSHTNILLGSVFHKYSQVIRNLIKEQMLLLWQVFNLLGQN